MTIMYKDRINELISSAIDARRNSYSPYSHFCVGAALMTKSGKIYKGANAENISYPIGICAERSAFAAALSDGEREFSAIAVVGGNERENNVLSDFCSPCGMCRQFIAEFCDGDFPIILAKSIDEYKIYTAAELLPFAFKLK